MCSMTKVTLANLTKTFGGGGVEAVSDVSFTVESGTLTGLLGPSGSGKTTTMKMIAGLLHPTSGDICFDEQSILQVPPERRGAAMVFQNYLLFPHMNVADNIGFGLKMRRVDKATIRSRVCDMLDLVQLPGLENRHPKELSGGQQQRVALARALIIEPKVLLLDEPLSNLDAYLRDEMRELIRRVQRELKITTLFVTHDQEEAVVLADKIALMFDGALRQYAVPEDFYEVPGSLRIAKFFGGVNFVPGQLRGNTVSTSVGEFRVTRTPVPDGDVVMSIRPEAVTITESVTENVVQGRIATCIYMGRYTRFKVAVGDDIIEATTAPGQASAFCDGDVVTLHLPPEKIWLLPSE